MAVIAFRPREGAGTESAPGSTHPPLDGTFRAPTGALGLFVGSLRVERLLVTPHGVYVRAVVTGVLKNTDDVVIGRDSRAMTLVAELRRQDGCTMACIEGFDVDLMGITVRVSPVSLDPHFATSPRRHGRLHLV